ncbi:Methionyl-tRNA formyltransferase [Thecaphora frezii]
MRPTLLLLLHRTVPLHRPLTARPPPYTLLFCGTDKFALASLSALVGRPDLCQSIHVVTPPDNLQGWGAERMKVAPVKQLALERHLPHQDVPPGGMDEYELPASVRDAASPLLLTCSFGHMIPTSLLSHFPPSHRLNIHPSLLPQLRGAAPLQWTIARRLTEGGITVQTLEEDRFDAGRVFAQRRIEVPSGIEYAALERRVAPEAAKVVVEVLEDLKGCEQRSWKQDEAEVTWARKVRREDVEIRWDKWAAEEVVARSRAFGYLYPLTTTLHPHPSSRFPTLAHYFEKPTFLSHSTLKSSDPKVFSLLTSPSLPPGSGTFSKKLQSIVVKSLPNLGLDTFVATRRLKPYAKASKTAKEWWLGYRDRGDKNGVVSFASPVSPPGQERIGKVPNASQGA